MTTVSDLHRTALQAGFLVRQRKGVPPARNEWYEVLCANTAEVISPRTYSTRERAWAWAYEQVQAGRTALEIANEAK